MKKLTAISNQHSAQSRHRLRPKVIIVFGRDYTQWFGNRLHKLPNVSNKNSSMHLLFCDKLLHLQVLVAIRSNSTNALEVDNVVQSNPYAYYLWGFIPPVYYLLY